MIGAGGRSGPPAAAVSEWGRAVFWPAGARWRGGLWLLAIFCAYAGVALLYPFTETGGVALLWMPNAVLVTALLRFRWRDWPYVYAAGLLAEVAADLTYNVAPHQALYFGLVNAIEATLVVLFAAFIARGRSNIGLLSVRGAVAVILAAVLVPSLTATIGALGSVWTFGSDYFTGWRTWWFGDALGLLVGIPLGLMLRDTARSVARCRTTPTAVGGGVAAALLLALSGILAAAGSAWGAQQTALAASVILALTFGAAGAPVAAVLTASVTLIGLARSDDFGSAPQEQALLFVAFAAIYAIAATTEAGNRAMGELTEAHKKLERLARFDPLTGLVNRAEALTRLQSALDCSRSPGEHLGVLFCDVDRFKAVNDTYGHASGDIVLATLADRVCESVRHGDTVGRTGGDELLVLLPGLHNVDEAARIAEKIRARAAEPIHHSGASFSVTLSIGATLAMPGESVVDTSSRADAAMYQAKRQGGNAVASA